MKNIRLIIFDLDGTLLDAYGAIIESFNYAMRKVASPKRDSLTIRRAVGWGDENLLRPFVGKDVLRKALRIYRSHHKHSLIRQTHLFPGSEKLLSSLKAKGYKLAVASNRPTRFSRILIRHLKIDKYFDYMLCADKLKQGKPHPQILNAIRKRLKVRASETLYVGDMIIDIQAGRRAHVLTVAVATGSSTFLELKKEKPSYIIRSIAGLAAFLS
jgi:phosphoglycolate phosphatase